MKNSEYWQERFKQLEAAQNRLAQMSFKEIEAQYRAAQRELEGKINTWYQRIAKNNNISMAEARKLLSADEIEEFKWTLSDYIKHGEENALNGKWIKQLENASAKFHISKYQAMMIDTRHSFEQLFGQQHNAVLGTMGRIYENGYYKTAYELQKGMGIGFDVGKINRDELEKVLSKPWAADGRNFSERIWGNKDKLINEVHNELTQNIITGADPQKAIDAIAKKMNASKSNAGRLVMTEEAYFSSAAQGKSYNDLGVEQYDVLATLDSHTSEICQSLDGKTFDMKDYKAGVTAPPFHVRCRSTTVPHLDEEVWGVGERAARSEDGKTYYVPDNITYPEWNKGFVEGDKEGLTEVNDDGIIKNKDTVVSSVEDTSDFDELCRYMHEKYNAEIYEDVTKLDFDTVKQSLIGIESVIAEYPEVGKIIETVKTSNFGVMSCTGSTITFNPAYYYNGNDLLDKCQAASQMGTWINNCSPRTIGAHEAGHGVEWLLIQNNPYYDYDFQKNVAWNTCSEAKLIVKEAINNLKKTPYGKGKKKTDLIGAISKYALESDSETLAEAFHDVYANGEKANPLSIEIKKITEEKMNQYKKGK